MAKSSLQRNGWNGFLMSAAIGAATLGIASPSFASLLIDFKLESGAASKVAWGSGALTGANASANSPDTKYVGGLMLDVYTGLELPNLENVGAMIYRGNTTLTRFSGVTFEFNLAADGDTETSVITTGGNTVFNQRLASGTFKFWSRDPDGTETPRVLLSGTITGAALEGLVNGRSASVSTDETGVTFDGGELLPLIAKGKQSMDGSLSMSLFDTSSALTVSGTQLTGFSSNVVGTLNVVPEPATVGLLSLVVASAALARRRRKSDKVEDQPQAE